VQPGSTASGIAQEHREPGVSLDQMLLAMLVGNPSAFIEDNINRLRAGATLNLPAADEATRVSVAEANRLLWSGTTDFNAYRAKLAEMATATATPQASREASGKVEARSEERPAALQPTDRLTLSKGALDASNAKADAGKAPSGDERAWVAELNRTIEEIARLKAATEAQAPASATASSGAPGAPASAGVGPGVTAPMPVPPASAAKPDGGLIDSLLTLSAVPWIGGALVALLVLLAGMRVRQRRSQSLLDLAGSEGAAGAAVPEGTAATTGATSAPDRARAPAPTRAPGFDFGSLSLDLEPQPETSGSGQKGAADPLSTKLALADELRKLGNVDGARTLLDEVLAQAEGERAADTRARAQRMRDELG
jgi:pilus assembly protein FimV